MADFKGNVLFDDFSSLFSLNLQSNKWEFTYDCSHKFATDKLSTAIKCYKYCLNLPKISSRLDFDENRPLTCSYRQKKTFKQNLAYYLAS